MILNYATDIQAGTDPANFVYLGGQLVWQRAMPVAIDETKVNYIELDSRGNPVSVTYYPDVNTPPNFYKQYYVYIGSQAGITSIPPAFEVTEYGTVSSCFYRAGWLVRIRLPASVELMGTGSGLYGTTGVFLECENLKSIEFSENSKLESIQQNAFAGCASLRSLEFPESETFTLLPRGCCTGCEALEEVIVPRTVERIYVTSIPGSGYQPWTYPPNAFSNCPNLRRITIHKPENSIPDLYMAGGISYKWGAPQSCEIIWDG